MGTGPSTEGQPPTITRISGSRNPSCCFMVSSFFRNYYRPKTTRRPWLWGRFCILWNTALVEAEGVEDRLCLRSPVVGVGQVGHDIKEKRVVQEVVFIVEGEAGNKFVFKCLETPTRKELLEVGQKGRRGLGESDIEDRYRRGPVGKLR